MAEMRRVAHFLQLAGSIDYSLDKAGDYLRQARENLLILPEGGARNALELLAEFVSLKLKQPESKHCRKRKGVSDRKKYHADLPGSNMSDVRRICIHSQSDTGQPKNNGTVKNRV